VAPVVEEHVGAGTVAGVVDGPEEGVGVVVLPEVVGPGAPVVVVPGVVVLPGVPVVAVPLGVVGVPPTAAPVPVVVPVPAEHDPVVGVTTGVVEVKLGVEMTSTLEDAAPVPAEPVEGIVVETVVVSVRPS
jgi:hypothetical protein